MGSDDGKKRDRPDRPSWCLFLCLCAVVTPLLVVYHMERQNNTPEKPRSFRGNKQRVVSPALPCGTKTSLRRDLEAIAGLPPGEALRALDLDPLGVDGVKNASVWRCPEERLLPREDCGPSLEAERRLRSKQRGAVLWFEHLSKAGGTSFCKFARQNVGMARTPSYYCMPSDGAKIPGTDGRVGRWQKTQIEAYLQRTGHLVLANEWDSFPANEVAENLTVLAAVVRDPLDRLVSAYKFWGVTHNPSKTKPEVTKWLDMKDRQARLRPHRKFPDDFLSQVARNNFAVWKFASHTDPTRFDDCQDDSECHRDALSAALDNLEKFHVPVPMTWQSSAGPLYDRLGWSKLTEIHIVPSGTTHNSAAKSDLDTVVFSRLREANLLDLLLFAWVRRAFLERLHCPRTYPVIR